MSDKRYWLWFVLVFGPGNERIWEILSYFKDVERAYEAICDGCYPSLNAREKRKITETHIEQCDSIISYCQENFYRIITFEDENYPPLLRNIYNPPAVLFCMGNIENFISCPAVTCVGTRRPSCYSVNITEKICSELAARGFAIVSGFAVGLDSAAHRGALSKNGCTVAVLACGIDVAYPKDNEKSKKYIIKNGALITEFLPGSHPDGRLFHQRNRILAGLSFGTLVTEADENSGSLITAAHAADQGRTVFCVPPGDIFDKRYTGVVKYLRDGAIPVFSHLDILYEYYVSGRYEVDKNSFNWPELYGEDDIPYRDTRNVKKKRKARNQLPVQQDKQTENDTCCKWMMFYDEMDGDQKIITDFLKEGEKHPDEISNATGMELFGIMTVMTELEMMGAVELLPNHKYKLC